MLFVPSVSKNLCKTESLNPKLFEFILSGIAHHPFITHILQAHSIRIELLVQVKHGVSRFRKNTVRRLLNCVTQMAFIAISAVVLF